MITLIISIIVALIVAICVVRNMDDSIFSGAFIAIITFMGCIFVMSIVTTSIFYDNIQPIETYELAAINDGSTTTGSFFLGCGSIDSKQYYFCYIVKEDGGFTMTKYLVDDCVIYESDTCQPHIVKYDRIVPEESKKWSIFIFDSECWKIYVPSGSIDSNFKLDLE